MSPAEQRAADRAYAARAQRDATLATQWAADAEDASDAALLRYERQVSRWLLRHPTGAITDGLIAGALRSDPRHRSSLHPQPSR